MTQPVPETLNPTNTRRADKLVFEKHQILFGKLRPCFQPSETHFFPV